MCLSSSLLKSCEAMRKSESAFSGDESVAASAMVRYNKNNILGIYLIVASGLKERFSLYQKGENLAREEKGLYPFVAAPLYTVTRSNSLSCAPHRHILRVDTNLQTLYHARGQKVLRQPCQPRKRKIAMEARQGHHQEAPSPVSAPILPQVRMQMAQTFWRTLALTP